MGDGDGVRPFHRFRDTLGAGKTKIMGIFWGKSPNLGAGTGNISSLHLEFLWQPGKNQKKKVVFPERREGGTVVLTERSEVKTVPPERREGKTFF